MAAINKKSKNNISKICETCNTTFQVAKGNKQANRFCSKVCFHNRVKEYYKCIECGNDCKRHFTGLEYNTKKFYCSSTCKEEIERKRNQAKIDAAKPLNDLKEDIKWLSMSSNKFTRSIIAEMNGWIKQLKEKHEYQSSYQRICKLCGTHYISGKRLSYCSVQCSQKADGRRNNLYRASLFGCEYVKFNPIDVMKRDNWICQACGIDTPKSLRGTLEWNAPELDHIIPMSKGGAHSPDNAQCLCRNCNHIKSNNSNEYLLEKLCKKM